MEFTKVKVRVDDDVYIDIEYRWEVFEDRVDVVMRYEDMHTETASFWPSDPQIDAGHAIDLVRMCAALKYSQTTD